MLSVLKKKLALMFIHADLPNVRCNSISIHRASSDFERTHDEYVDVRCGLE